MLIVSILIALVSFYFLGERHGIEKQLVKQQKLQQQLQKNIDDAEKQYQQKLAQVNSEKQQWFELANKQSLELANSNIKLNALKEQLRKDISNAVQKDKDYSNDCHLLGTNSLHIYNRALGYSDSD